ncbi:HNH endonuclease signature motif containing protein [Limosilactobacillus sp. WILCCON 0053]|uniref:HNH endonuclease signature motif containing protein n=1 Tax=Limosilactobacillus allomucosae TaxID=3142938 RepID=UPI0032656B6B
MTLFSISKQDQRGEHRWYFESLGAMFGGIGDDARASSETSERGKAITYLDTEGVLLGYEIGLDDPYGGFIGNLHDYEINAGQLEWYREVWQNKDVKTWLSEHKHKVKIKTEPRFEGYSVDLDSGIVFDPNDNEYEGFKLLNSGYLASNGLTLHELVMKEYLYRTNKSKLKKLVNSRDQYEIHHIDGKRKGTKKGNSMEKLALLTAKEHHEITSLEKKLKAVGDMIKTYDPSKIVDLGKIFDRK